MSKGRITINKKGYRNVTGDGNLDITYDNSHGTCCCCKPYTLASFTTGGGTWNLSPYQNKDGVAEPNRYWRLTNNYTSYVPVQRGCVDKNGRLVGLPGSTSTTTYKYTWTFLLEIGCLDETGNYVKFPTGSEPKSYYNCPKS